MCKITELTKSTIPEEGNWGSFILSILTNKLEGCIFILQYELMINKWDNNNNKKKDDTISQDAHCTLNHYNKIQ